MKTFTFAKLNKLGEFDEKYGQGYWGETNEQLIPVKFNSMNQGITVDDTIEAEEILLKESKKGTEYHQLKKVKVLGGTVNYKDLPPAQKEELQKQVGIGQTQLDRIEAKLDRILKLTELEITDNSTEHLEAISREEY